MTIEHTEQTEPGVDAETSGSADALCTFIPEMQFPTERIGDRFVGRSGPPPAALLYPGQPVLRLSALFTFADVLIGSAAAASALPRVTMTIDLNVRTARPLDVTRGYTGYAESIKVGRTINVGEGWFTNVDDDVPSVYAYGTFMASPRPVDVMTEVGRSRWPRHAEPMTVPFPDRVGVAVVRPGVAEVARRPDTINLTDTLQGGIIGLAAEEAACSLRPGATPVELDVRFLSTVRVGPARATAVDHGGFVRVEVVDAGRDDRLVAVTTVRFA